MGLLYLYLTCKMWRVSASQRKTCPASCINLVSKNVVLTAIHETTTHGSRLEADWNGGKHCGTLPAVTRKVLGEVVELSDKIMSPYSPYLLCFESSILA
jgi:hypothetical protein